MRILTFLMVSGGALALPGVARAQDQAGPGSAPVANDIIVVANRGAQPAERVGASVTLLTRRDIDSTQTVILSDLLARAPGVSVARNGGPGGISSIFIRGADSDQTVALIDGVKLNDPSAPGTGFDFANLVAGDIARVEVLRGPQSTLYGSQAIGGVVNIITAGPAPGFSASGQAEGGSFGSALARIALGGQAGRLGFRLGGSWLTTAGISAFDANRFDRAGRLIGVARREPDGYQNGTVTARLTYQLSGAASLDQRVYFTTARNDFDGFPPPNFSFADTRDYGRTEQLVSYSGLNLATLGGRLRNRVAFQYTRVDRRNYDPDQAVTPVTFDALGENLRAEYQGTLEVSKGIALIFGAEHETSRFRTAAPSAFAPNPTPDRAATGITSGYAQATLDPLASLTLTGGVRYDAHARFGGAVTGQASLAWRPAAGTIVRLSYGSGFKAPSLFQLYSPFGTRSLRPESADGWDGGIEQSLWGGRLSVRATGFARVTRDQIGFFSCFGSLDPRCPAQPFGFYLNLGRTEAYGAELEAVLRPVDGLELAANYSFLDARDRSGGANRGRELARRPQQQGNASLSYRWRFGLTTGVALRVAGRSFDDFANTTRLAPYALVDLRVAYPVGEHLELYARIENLGNARYQTTYQYGAQGRAAYGGIRLRL